MPRYSPRTGLLSTYQVGPFSTPHLYLTWGGPLPGNEQWTCGVRLAPTSAQSEAQAVSAAAALLPDYVTPLKAWFISAQSMISSTCRMNWVKCNAIGTDGEYIEDTTNEAAFADIYGSVGMAVPNQIALAISLITGFNRGPAHRGRFFSPMPAIAVGADGLIAAADRNYTKTSAETLLAGINNQSAVWDVHVMSRKAGAPAHRSVSGIEVGRVLDTQRRRRNKLPETY